MTPGIGIVCEDNGHFRAVTRLVDDELRANVNWLDEVWIEHCRSFRGLNAPERWYKYDPDDACDIRPVTLEGRTFRRHGRIGGRPPEPEARMWRNVLLLFLQSEPHPDVLVLVRDLDGYSGRKTGMEQARDSAPWPFPIVIATAQPEVEAWHVCGFEPRNDHERERLAILARELCFDPRYDSHRLTSHPNDAPTDAKKVLARLCDSHGQGDDDRKMACLEDRDSLRERGQLNGLADFLCQVVEHLLPLFPR